MEEAVRLRSKWKLTKALQTATVPTPARIQEMLRSGALRNARLVMTVEVEGWKGGRPKTIRHQVVCPDLKTVSRLAPGATYISYPTAAAAAAFVQSLPLVKAKGVFPAETLNIQVRKAVLKRLRQYGIKFATMGK